MADHGLSAERDHLAALLHETCGCGRAAPHPNARNLGCRIAYAQADKVIAAGYTLPPERRGDG